MKNIVGASENSYCFRGQVNHTWQSLPTLLRKPRYEAILLQKALLVPYLMESGNIPYLISNDPVELMMVLQHFGMPTKLLDLTYDPLVALFFACHDPKQDNIQTDGKVIIYPPPFLYDRLKIEDPSLDLYKERIPKEQVTELVFERISPDRHLFFSPLIKNARMRSQNGCFFLFSSYLENEKRIDFISLEKYQSLRNPKIIEENEKREQKHEILWHAHLLIDKDYKSQILDELRLEYGISKTSLFPNTDYTKSAEVFFQDYYKRALDWFEHLKARTPRELENKMIY